jgi:hypothetical protein
MPSLATRKCQKRSDLFSAPSSPPPPHTHTHVRTSTRYVTDEHVATAPSFSRFKISLMLAFELAFVAACQGRYVSSSAYVVIHMAACLTLAHASTLAHWTKPGHVGTVTAALVFLFRT